MDKLRKINEELMKQLSKQRSDASSSSSKPDTPRMKRLDREMVSGKNPQDLANQFLVDQFGKGFDFNINLSDLLVDKQIGSGASANVYKGTYKEMDVAIKKLRFSQPDPHEFNPTAANQVQQSLKEF
jgi:hypothetical protein